MCNYITTRFKRRFFDLVSYQIYLEGLIMKNKKGVIGIMGTLLIILMVISISSPSNSADENFESDNPYEEVMQDLDDSINQVAQNNDRIKAIDNDVEDYKNQLGNMIDTYESLNNELQKNLDKLEGLSDVVGKTQKNSNNIEEKLDVLRENVQKNEEKFISENSGIKISPIFILMFFLFNCIVLVQISSYYKKKYAY